MIQADCVLIISCNSAKKYYQIFIYSTFQNYFSYTLSMQYLLVLFDIEMYSIFQIHFVGQFDQSIFPYCNVMILIRFLTSLTFTHLRQECNNCPLCQYNSYFTSHAHRHNRKAPLNKSYVDDQ